MRRILRSAAVSLFLVAGTMAANAHASLVNSSPLAGSAMKAAPGQVVLTFTDKLEPAFSKLTVTDANGTEASQGQAQIKDGTMSISLKALTSGTYRVNWQAVSSDTHKTDGSFTFSVTPDN